MKSVFKNKGFLIDGIISFSPKETLEECLNGAMILDLRRDFEIRYKQFAVENIIFARPDYVKDNYQELPKDRPLIVADNAGIRSKEIVTFLLDKGFDNVANLIGGIFEWDRDGLPLKVDNLEMLSGSCLCVLRKKKL